MFAACRKNKGAIQSYHNFCRLYPETWDLFNRSSNRHIALWVNKGAGQEMVLFCSPPPPPPLLPESIQGVEPMDSK